MAAYQAPPSLGFSRQEHWSGLPFPSPVHGSEKWKWSRSVVSNSLRSHGLHPTRLLRPWDFAGKSTGVGCHCLLPKSKHYHSQKLLQVLEATGATRKSSQLSPVQSPLIWDNLFIFRGVKRDLWKRPWCWERFRAGGEGATDNKMVGRHHRLNEHEFEQTPGDSGWGSLVSCSSQGCKESDTTVQLNNRDLWKQAARNFVAASGWSQQPRLSLLQGHCWICQGRGRAGRDRKVDRGESRILDTQAWHSFPTWFSSAFTSTSNSNNVIQVYAGVKIGHSCFQMSEILSTKWWHTTCSLPAIW